MNSLRLYRQERRAHARTHQANYSLLTISHLESLVRVAHVEWPQA